MVVTLGVFNLYTYIVVLRISVIHVYIKVESMLQHIHNHC